MKVRNLRDPITNQSLIRKMKSLDPLGWQRFCDQYRNRLKAMCFSHDFPADIADEISSRVVARLYEDFAAKRDIPWTSFRGYLSNLAIQEMNRYIYETRRFFGFQRGFLCFGVLRGKWYFPVDPTEFADEIAQDLSPRLVMLHDLLDKVRSNVSAETWNTFYRIEILGDSYRNLAGEMGVEETALRSCVYRVKRMIGKYSSLEGTDHDKPA